jgi:hypothetical protein
LPRGKYHYWEPQEPKEPAKLKIKLRNSYTSNTMFNVLFIPEVLNFGVSPWWKLWNCEMVHYRVSQKSIPFLKSSICWNLNAILPCWTHGCVNNVIWYFLCSCAL